MSGGGGEVAEVTFYIVDLRSQWRKHRYITLWRPNNANYAWPLPWAGRYTREQVDAEPGYYAKLRYGCKRAWDRFPVPAAVVERLATHQPRDGEIDGNVGPVLLNDAATRRELLRHKHVPANPQTPRTSHATG